MPTSVSACQETTYKSRSSRVSKGVSNKLKGDDVDSDLAVVIAGWPELPPAVKVGIMAMVRAASNEHPPRQHEGEQSVHDDTSLEGQRDE